MKTPSDSRRQFLKKAITGTAVASLGGVLPAFSARSYARILGANERVRVGLMGVNSRGLALATTFGVQPNCEIISVADVDTRAMDKCIATVKGLQDTTPKAHPDFRKALEDNTMDALVIAAPDHWHAPAAILASKAGKHVYLEKPCSHSPQEGELLIAVAKKYKNTIQCYCGHPGGQTRHDWPALFCQRVVYEQPGIDWPRKTNRRTGLAGL
jgi:hypothetical protein